MIRNHFWTKKNQSRNPISSHKKKEYATSIYLSIDFWMPNKNFSKNLTFKTNLIWFWVYSVHPNQRSISMKSIFVMFSLYANYFCGWSRERESWHNNINYYIIIKHKLLLSSYKISILIFYCGRLAAVFLFEILFHINFLYKIKNKRAFLSWRIYTCIYIYM